MNQASLYGVRCFPSLPLKWQWEYDLKLFLLDASKIFVTVCHDNF